MEAEFDRLKVALLRGADYVASRIEQKLASLDERYAIVAKIDETQARLEAMVVRLMKRVTRWYLQVWRDAERGVKKAMGKPAPPANGPADGLEDFDEGLTLASTSDAVAYLSWADHMAEEEAKYLRVEKAKRDLAEIAQGLGATQIEIDQMREDFERLARRHEER